jgi:hypothetical protein
MRRDGAVAPGNVVSGESAARQNRRLTKISEDT